jgi:hypothetical protein
MAGENVQALVQSLTQLCAGSLLQNVPPHDTLLALEGLLSLKEQHNIFQSTWFLQQCWTGLFLPCLRVSCLLIIALCVPLHSLIEQTIVLRMHERHEQQVNAVFVALCAAKLHIAQEQNDLNAAVEFWNFVAQEVTRLLFFVVVVVVDLTIAVYDGCVGTGRQYRQRI